MKLSHLYTNNDSVFMPIKFRDDLNAIVARIQYPSDDDKSSHCLGKTLIIDVIDFCLLKAVGTKGIFLKTREDIFGELIFFLEIQVRKEIFITVRRAVRKATKIAFMRHEKKYLNLSQTPDEKWNHTDVSLTDSVRMLDGYLNLEAIKPWPYRKGFGYFLRRQEDYVDEFELRKFMSGKHKDWKPYIAKVLGFDDRPLIDKYEADAEANVIKAERDKAQREVTIDVADYEKLQANILTKIENVSGKLLALDRFDFNAQEIGLNQELVNEIEEQIAELNEDIYNTTFDLSQVNQGLTYKLDFNLKDIQKIFKEAEVVFPKELVKDYYDLINFNKMIHKDRQSGLKERASELETSLDSLSIKLHELSERRKSILQVLGETDSLEKFKKLQKELDRDRANLLLMQEKASKLSAIKALNERLRKAESQQEGLTIAIKGLLSNSPERYREIQRAFNRIINEILHRTANLYVRQNDSGNIEFCAEYTEPESDEKTQERRATSFKKILCIAFDLAVLINYSDELFFHFVYHDGALEQMESRRKLALLDVVRTTCKKYNVQYIFSVIEEDLPTADDPKKLCPQPAEIVLELHDGGTDGRLFKLNKF